ncbi:hypothetical protein ACQ4PT_062576 [Festuca glaucescens]
MSSTSGTTSAPSQGLAAASSTLCQALLYSPDVGLQLNAVTALLNLSILDANKKRIMHADGPVARQGQRRRGPQPGRGGSGRARRRGGCRGGARRRWSPRGGARRWSSGRARRWSRGGWRLG